MSKKDKPLTTNDRLAALNVNMLRVKDDDAEFDEFDSIIGARREEEPAKKPKPAPAAEKEKTPADVSPAVTAEVPTAEEKPAKSAKKASPKSDKAARKELVFCNQKVQNGTIIRAYRMPLAVDATLRSWSCKLMMSGKLRGSENKLIVMALMYLISICPELRKTYDELVESGFLESYGLNELDFDSVGDFFY